jgi:hypothetical protein
LGGQSVVRYYWYTVHNMIHWHILHFAQTQEAKACLSWRILHTATWRQTACVCVWLSWNIYCNVYTISHFSQTQEAKACESGVSCTQVHGDRLHHPDHWACEVSVSHTQVLKPDRDGWDCMCLCVIIMKHLLQCIHYFTLFLDTGSQALREWRILLTGTWRRAPCQCSSPGNPPRGTASCNTGALSPRWCSSLNQHAAHVHHPARSNQHTQEHTPQIMVLTLHIEKIEHIEHIFIVQKGYSSSRQQQFK